MLELVFWIVVAVFLSLLDGALTGYSVRVYEKVKKFYKFETFELNPKMRDTYGKGVLIEPKRVIMVLLMIPLPFAYFWFFLPFLFEIVAGSVVLNFLTVNLFHIENLVNFSRMQGRIKGKIELLKQYSITQVIMKLFTVEIILIVTWLLTPNNFLLGGLIGNPIQMIVLWTWRNK